MTGIAAGGESRRSVIRIRGRVVLRHVARTARRRESRVHATIVTVRTRMPGVAIGEREGCRVREVGAAPGDGVVAISAVGAEAGRDVIWIGHMLVVIEVARGAVVRQAGVHAARVTLRTILSCVPARERETRRVLEVRAAPAGGVVTLSAVHAEAGRGVIRRRGPLKIAKVTADAVGRKTCEHTTAVALGAGLSGMSGSQREGCGMCEVCGLPRDWRVAALTIVDPAVGRMIG